MKKLFLYIAIAISSSFCFAQCQNKIYTVVEQMPSFPGGETELFKFINQNLKYPVIPEDKILDNLSTKIQFVVTKTGEIKDIKVMKLQYEGTILTDSLISVIRRMPR